MRVLTERVHQAEDVEGGETTQGRALKAEEEAVSNRRQPKLCRGHDDPGTNAHREIGANCVNQPRVGLLGRQIKIVLVVHTIMA